MVDTDQIQQLMEDGTGRDRIRETLPEADQPRFDEAWEQLEAAVKEHAQRISQLAQQNSEAATETLQALANTLAGTNERFDSSNSGDVIATLNQLTERVRALPEPQSNRFPTGDAP